MNEFIENDNDLMIDKENDFVIYNDKLHKYWTREDNKVCISATTLIHKFQNFDEDFWSSYKALEALVDEENFLAVKNELTLNKVFNEYHYTSLGISTEEFLEKKKEILEDWAEKREASCIRGSAIHKELENSHLNGETKELQFLQLGGKFNTDTTNKIKFGEKGVYPEILLSRISEDKKLRVAGQADLVIVDKDEVYILDYKTSKSIDKKSFYDRRLKKSTMMKYPLNNLMDTNFWHYSLQLSLYAWMIQKADPRFVIKKLVLIHYDHKGNCDQYECEYLKNDVERMLAYYKKQIDYEKFKESRQKISF